MRRSRRSFAALAIAFVSLTGCPRGGLPAVQDGDILFQEAQTPESLALQKATHSQYSQLGIATLRRRCPSGWPMERAATTSSSAS
jgi:hypothetical protein